MYGLRLSTEVCPDGVEPLWHETSADLEAAVGLIWFRYRSNRRQPLVREFANLENPIVVKFINASTEEKRIQFLKLFGLPAPRPDGSEPRQHILNRQRILRRLLAKAGSGDAGKAIETANNALASFKVRPMLENSGGKPRLILSADDLLTFMYLEAALVAASGARFAECQYCGDVFLTGKATANRSTARFCRDKCRVNAYRKSNPKGGRHVGAKAQVADRKGRSSRSLDR
jgi:ribosomal protein L24E